MTSVWPTVVPLALGAAVSPALLTIQLLILAGKSRPVPRGWAYTAGVFVTTVIYMVVLATIARGIVLASSNQSDVERIVKLVAAAGLLFLGVHALRKKRDPAKIQARDEKLAKAPLRDFFGIGFAAMWGNLSSLVLILPAVHITINSDATSSTIATMMGLILLCAIAPALLPVLLLTLAGSHADPALASLNRFTTAHAQQINAGICFLFAALLVYSGLKP
ncbi:MAG: GAP family protein [Candidatus Nanopelagicales bacterium]